MIVLKTLGSVVIRLIVFVWALGMLGGSKAHANVTFCIAPDGSAAVLYPAGAEGYQLLNEACSAFYKAQRILERDVRNLELFLDNCLLRQGQQRNENEKQKRRLRGLLEDQINAELDRFRDCRGETG